MISRHVRRVDQLDAISLDSELFALLNSHYRKAFLYVPSFVAIKAGRELDLLFRFLFKYLPLEYLGATFGQKVFELTYCNSETFLPASKNKIRLLAALSVGLPWFVYRIATKTILKFCRSESSHRVFEVSEGLELKIIILWKMFSLINFCIFLQKSAFPSVTERILQIRPLYTVSQDIKFLQYDGVSKELLWHGLAEFLGFTLPLINVFRMKNYIKRLWSSFGYNEKYSKYGRKNDNCLICGSVPNFPHTIGCDHLFCYYCIASMLLADPSFSCMDCDFIASGLDCIKPVPLNRPKSINYSE